MGSALKYYLFDFWNLLDMLTTLANYVLFALKLTIYFDDSGDNFKINTVPLSLLLFMQ